MISQNQLKKLIAEEILNVLLESATSGKLPVDAGGAMAMASSLSQSIKDVEKALGPEVKSLTRDVLKATIAPLGKSLGLSDSHLN